MCLCKRMIFPSSHPEEASLDFRRILITLICLGAIGGRSKSTVTSGDGMANWIK